MRGEDARRPQRTQAPQHHTALCRPRHHLGTQTTCMGWGSEQAGGAQPLHTAQVIGTHVAKTAVPAQLTVQDGMQAQDKEPQRTATDGSRRDVQSHAPTSVPLPSSSSSTRERDVAVRSSSLRHKCVRVCAARFGLGRHREVDHRWQL